MQGERCAVRRFRWICREARAWIAEHQRTRFAVFVRRQNRRKTSLRRHAAGSNSFLWTGFAG